MTHPFYAACGALAVASTLALSAQTPAPSAPRPQTPAPSPSPSSTPARADGTTVTLTGCLKPQAADNGRPGSAAPEGATSSKFVLTNVQGDVPGMTKPGASSQGTKTAGALGTQWVVTADAGVNLAAHLNHQVRVTGKHTEIKPVDPAATPGDPLKPDSTASPGEAPQPGMRPDKTWPALAVSSVTMLSSSCTATTK